MDFSDFQRTSASADVQSEQISRIDSLFFHFVLTYWLMSF